MFNEYFCVIIYEFLSSFKLISLHTHVFVGKYTLIYQNISAIKNILYTKVHINMDFEKKFQNNNNSNCYHNNYFRYCEQKFKYY